MNIKDFRKKEQEDARQTYEKYKDFSKEQLMQELLSTVKAQKQNGTFDKNQLLSTLALLTPSLSEEQKQRLYSLVEQL